MANEEPILGGFHKRNPAEYTDKAWKAIPEINAKVPLTGVYLIPIKVLKAQVQVVAGTITELEVLTGESSCVRISAAPVTSTNCSVKPGGARQLYKLSIWTKLWENFEQITAEKIRDVKKDEQF